MRSATLAALVVDNRERRVLAYVGNADVRRAGAPRHARHGAGGALAGIGAEAVYLRMAFDRLIIHPETRDRRSPAPFRRLRAERFRRKFPGRGQRPRGAAIFAERAGRRGARTARSEPVDRRRSPPPASDCICRRARSEPGLAIALGGAGITLTDLATLYAGLAEGGRVAPLRYSRRPIRRTPGTAMFGPVAAWYVNDILAGAPPPPGMAAGRDQARTALCRSRPAPPTVSAMPGRSAMTAT